MKSLMDSVAFSESTQDTDEGHESYIRCILQSFFIKGTFVIYYASFTIAISHTSNESQHEL